MPEQTPTVGMERKLAAIVSTDVAGYSRLMGDDEEATIRTLTAYRALISSLIQHYRGRVVDSPGDNLLAEFASVVDAVRSAVEIQQALKEQNAELPEQRRMQFRISINLGDVVIEGERIYGDGVNIAARLESLASPGGICISGTVYDQVKNKVALGYEYLGERAVKNIAEPVRVYRIAIEVPFPLVGEGQGEGNVGEAERLKAKGKNQKAKVENKGLRARRPRAILMALGAFVASGIAVFLLFLPLRTQHSGLSTPSPLSTQDLALRTNAAPAALPLPDKPSLVVLPFVNMSKDPDQEYFSDGLTEVLTGDLSKISSLFVIARNSAFTYKGKAVKVQDVGREMGVRYVLEGSVQKADQRVRITTQLIEAATGYHLWSEQYDRPLTDIFALQDEIVQKIVTTLKLQLTLEEQGIIIRKHTDNLEAYDAVLRGVEYFWRLTKEANTQARQMFEKALTLDPQYAEAYAWLGWTYWIEWVYRWSADPQNLERALVLAQQAVALDDSLPIAHSILSIVYAQQQQYDQAIAEGERAVALAPNEAWSYAALAWALSCVGRTEDALEAAAQAQRLKTMIADDYLGSVGIAYAVAGHYEEARASLQHYLSRYPNILPAHLMLAAVYSELGQAAEARAEAAEVLRLNPNFSLEVHKQRMPIKDPAVLERHMAALRKAGLT